MAQFGTYRNLLAYVVLQGDLKKTQFLVSDRDTVRIRRKTLPTTMMALNLDFGPLTQFQTGYLRT